MQIDREEVVLRRTVGVKKDEYFLDKKHVTCADLPHEHRAPASGPQRFAALRCVHLFRSRCALTNATARVQEN